MFGLSCFGVKVLWFVWNRFLVLGSLVKAQDLEKESKRKKNLMPLSNEL